MIIPSRWLRFVEVIADHTEGPIALHLRQKATRLLESHRASQATKRAKSAPRRVAEAADREMGRANTSELRATVFYRAKGACECCGHNPPTELHHLIYGPRRSSSQSVDTCAALCFECHRSLHRSDRQSLANMLAWAWANRFDATQSALQRRIDKLETLKP